MHFFDASFLGYFFPCLSWLQRVEQVLLAKEEDKK